MLANNNELISISHKIELKPNNKAKTHFKKAFGCARLAYYSLQKNLIEAIGETTPILNIKG